MEFVAAAVNVGTDGNDVGTFWDTEGMPDVEYRKTAWEAGDWNASWYCIQCWGEYWHCTKEEVMYYLGFTKRQCDKELFMNTRAFNAFRYILRKPPTITDTRFAKERQFRQIRCCGCREVKCGNEAGAFVDRCLPAGERKQAWENGLWDASWYCIDCYMQYYKLSREEVCDLLGFTERARKKCRGKG